MVRRSIGFATVFNMVLLCGCLDESQAARNELAGTSTSYMQSVETGKCFTTSGGYFHMDYCNGSVEQDFYFEGTPSSFAIHALQQNLCLDSDAAARRTFSPYLWGCYGGNPQKWRYWRGIPGVIESVERPGECLDLGLAAWGKPQPYLYSCYGGNPQKFNYSGRMIDLYEYLNGYIDQALPRADGLYVNGWTCVKKTNLNVGVQIYGGVRGQGGTLLARVDNLQADAAAQSRCASQVSAFRFSTVVPTATLKSVSTQRLNVYGYTSKGQFRAAGQFQAATTILPPCWAMEALTGECPEVIQAVEMTGNMLGGPSPSVIETTWNLCGGSFNVAQCVRDGIQNAQNTGATFGQWFSSLWGTGNSSGSSTGPVPVPAPTPNVQCYPGQWKDSFSSCVNGTRTKTSCQCKDGKWSNSCLSNTVGC